jgi:hypothetical protein
VIKGIGDFKTLFLGILIGFFITAFLACLYQHKLAGFVTIYGAVFASLFSALSVIILGSYQYGLAQQKRKDDLFSVRYEVYNKLEKVIDGVCNGYSSQDGHQHRDFYEMYDGEDFAIHFGGLVQEIKFLFGIELSKLVGNLIFDPKNNVDIDNLRNKFEEYLLIDGKA